MAEKSWVATDVDCGKIQIWLDDQGNLHLERHYVFVDAGGNEVPVGDRHFKEARPWAEVPQNIRDALQTLDTYSYNQILEEEEMVG